MKKSSRSRTATICAAFALAAAIFIGTGWRNHQHLTAARSENARLAATARELGIQLDERSGAALAIATPRETTRHRLREDATGRDDRLRGFATRVAAVLAELEALSLGGQPGDADFQKRLHGLIHELQGMPPEDLRALVAIFSSHPGIKDDARDNLAIFTIRTLADRHPQAALEMALDPASPLRGNEQLTNLIGHALERWAGENPAAALRWFEQHPEHHGDQDGEAYRSQLVAGVARIDPAHAFELIDRLGLKDLGAVGRMIANRGGGDDLGRDQVLTAMRAHLAKSPAGDEAAVLRTHVIAGLAQQATQNDGATAAIRWLDRAALAPEELAAVASRSAQLATPGHRREWLDWFASLEEPNARETGVRTMLHQWTPQDPAAAETWTRQQPPGPARDTAHEVLAGAMMKQDPARAMRHAEQLPPGQSRSANIRLILSEWQARDPEAANAYARAQGLE
jgi:hypothetical protein